MKNIIKSNFEKLGLGYKVADYSLNMVNKSQEFNNIINNPNFKYWGENSHEAQVGRIESKVSTVATSKEFEDSIGKDKKDFLLLSRHWKLHRLLLLSHLHKLGLDKSLVSWDNKFYHPSPIEELLKHTTADVINAAIRVLRTGEKSTHRQSKLRQVASEALGQLPRTTANETMEILNQFIINEKTLSIGYADNNGGVTHRIIDPIRISAGALIAKDHATGEVQSFRIPRITGVAPL